jgi:hypothetical protein
MRFPTPDQRKNLVVRHPLVAGIVWAIATATLLSAIMAIAQPAKATFMRTGMTLVAFIIFGPLWGYLTRFFIVRRDRDAR